MTRNNLVFFLAGLLIAGSISLAIAAPFGQDDAQAGAMSPPDMPMAYMRDFRHPGMMGHSAHWRHDPAHSVIMDIHSIERLDRISGRIQELPALYNHVLDKTQNPEVRHYAYLHLALSQMKPANVSQAEATLRKSLDEDLARLDAGTKP
ncbi:MAG TPA: hypothetical protein VFL15_02590 [Gammaproteobacteria bacterium]|nr:hypothetical protein [Gammaproteobacteria bacterium]